MKAFLYFLFQKCFNASYSKQQASDNDKTEEKCSMTFLDWLNVLDAASTVTNLNLRVHITSLLEMAGAINHYKHNCLSFIIAERRM